MNMYMTGLANISLSSPQKGVTPAWYRYAAREQISHYKTVTLTNGTVTKIAGSDAENFLVTTNCADNSLKTVRTRKIVLATGLKDNLPETPGIWENWGKGIYWVCSEFPDDGQ